MASREEMREVLNELMAEKRVGSSRIEGRVYVVRVNEVGCWDG
jgi:hypothetical protein